MGWDGGVLFNQFNPATFHIIGACSKPRLRFLMSRVMVNFCVQR